MMRIERISLAISKRPSIGLHRFVLVIFLLSPVIFLLYMFINTNSCIIISWWCWWTPNYYNYYYLSFKSHSISNYNYYYYHHYLILIILNPSHSLTFTLSNISNLSITIIPFLFLYHLRSLYIQNWGNK